MKLSTILAMLAVSAISFAQNRGAGSTANDPNQGAAVPGAKAKQTPTKSSQEEADSQRKRKQIIQAEKDGVEVRIKGIAHWRGIRSNQLMGFGLVMGLAGTGDTKKSIVTQQIIANMLKEFGIKLDPTQLDLKNIAAVMVTADLPPFATNGQYIDVEVQSMGDAKSLVGGALYQTPLYAGGDQSTVYATAQGALNLGGFDVSAGGSAQSKNFVTAGRIPEGGMVERGAPTKLVYDGKIYLELNQPDLTTAMRVASRINENFPNLLATANDGSTIEMTLPQGLSAMEAMSRIEELSVFADTQESIVVNEKTGTIVIGGNVRIGPAAIVQGSLSVRIDQDIEVSQPNPLSLGTTQTITKTNIDVSEPKADVADLAPNTTVADLAKVFHALQLKASDVISILQALRQQGALKARIITQ